MASNRRRRKTLSTRRIALLALMAIALSVAGWLHFTGAAGISGMATSDMDWDGDGTVTQREMLQAFHSVSVSVTREGPRECRAYRWRASQQSIRVDCKTEMPGDASGKAR